MYTDAQQKYAQGDIAGPATVGQIAQGTLECLTRTESWIGQIEDSIFGPSPRPVQESAPKMQPHLTQTANLINERVGELTERLARIAQAL